MKNKLLLAACFLPLMPLGAKTDKAALSVTGQATLYKPADQLNLSVGVVTEADTAATALQENNQKMKALIDALSAKQLSPQEYFTGQFNISPIYAPYPKDPPPDWTQKITAYRVNNSLTIRTDKLDLAGELIDAVTKAGANSIENMSFGLKDERRYRQELIQAATSNALQDAKALAAAADLKLIRIQQIWLDQAGSFEPRVKFAAAMMDRSTPIEKADVPIHGSVTVVYEVH